MHTLPSKTRAKVWHPLKDVFQPGGYAALADVKQSPGRPNKLNRTHRLHPPGSRSDPAKVICDYHAYEPSKG